jgi:chemotaxis protein CheD
VKEHKVRIAHHVVARGRTRLVTIGLGSCVAIVIHDRAAKVGGLAHVLLPHTSIGRDDGNRAKFASTAVPLLLEEMAALGATGPFVAKIIGGAGLFRQLLSAGGNIGARNVDAVRKALAAARVTLAAEDVGGDEGRSVFFDVGTGHVRVRSVRGGERVL